VKLTLGPVCGVPSASFCSKSAPQEVVRAVRAAPVPEPEPLNDFERARLENIRRNQEALAGMLHSCLCSQPRRTLRLTPRVLRSMLQHSWGACRLCLRR